MAEENQTTEDVSRETTLESYSQAQESADINDQTDRPEWLPEKRQIINTIILKELRKSIGSSGEIVVGHQEQMHGYGVTT